MHKEEMLSSLKGSRPLVLKHPEAVAATSEEQGHGNNHQHDGGVFSLWDGCDKMLKNKQNNPAVPGPRDSWGQSNGAWHKT